MSNEYVEVARFPSRMEAETIGHALDSQGIPFLVQSADIGIFGPGMTGFNPEGAGLRVPANRLEEVRQLISCVVQPLAEGELVAIEEAMAADNLEHPETLDSEDRSKES